MEKAFLGTVIVVSCGLLIVGSHQLLAGSLAVASALLLEKVFEYEA